MEAAGGINELYNFYVGKTLQNSYNQALGAFNAKLNYARGVDYTSLAAINSISQISQATANYYINRGAQAAASVGSSWGCTPGALTNIAINSFAANVNAAKNSVNSKIAAVKRNKVAQYNAYQAYLARLAAEAERQRQQAMVDAVQKAFGALAGMVNALAGTFGKRISTYTGNAKKAAAPASTKKPLTSVDRAAQSIANNLVNSLLGKPVAASKTPELLQKVQKAGANIADKLGFSNLAKDIRNFNLQNTSEQAVIDASYFSAYQGYVAIKPQMPDSRSMSFGILFIDPDEKSKETIRHELGHVPQYDKLGFAKYLYYVGIPSATSTVPAPRYYDQPWEVTADVDGGVVSRTHSPATIKEGRDYLDYAQNTSIWDDLTSGSPRAGQWSGLQCCP